jgi:hypothetical protein
VEKVSTAHADEANATWGRAGSFLLPILAALAALAVSWQRWINPFVDSGREMDVPWRLVQGERLYRDITYYYGPLGAWTNALALRLFGNRWVVLEGVCAVLSTLVFCLLFRLTRRAGGLLSATVATTLAAALCMGAPRGGAFLFPYSSASLFALAGGLLALDAATSSHPRYRLFCGLGLAVALTSRVEIGAAAAVALLVAGMRSRDREETRGDCGAVALGALLAGGIYALAFAGVSWGRLLADGPITPFLEMPVEWRALYLKVLGFEEPSRACGYLLASLALDAALLVAAARGTRGLRKVLFPAGGLLLLGLYAASPWGAVKGNLPPFLAILPLLAGLAALGLLVAPLAGRDRPRFLLFAFSAAVAGRVLFGLSVGPRMSAYAALPLPGLLATAAVLGFDVLAPRLPAPRLFSRRLAACCAILGALFLYRIGRIDNNPGIVSLETAAGTLRLPAPEASAIARTLSYLERNARDGETLTAFPESGFFNFVLGLRSPLRQDLIVPGVLAGLPEAATARQVDVAGPKYILLCNRPTPEYGPVAFGRDYAARLWTEVQGRYVLTGAFGWALPNAPVGTSEFFIRLYERNPAANAPVQLPSSGLRRTFPAVDTLVSQRLP